MSASTTDKRVYVQGGPTDLRWEDPRKRSEIEAQAIIDAAAQKTVMTFAGDAAAEVIAALFGEMKSGHSKAVAL